MKKEMLINVLQPEEIRIAIIEDGVLEELYVERTSHESYVGNIYKGRIVNIEPSIQAAFVDFGVGRNGFLHVSDVEPAYYRHLETQQPYRRDERGRGRGGRSERREPGRGRRDEPPRRVHMPDEEVEESVLEPPAITLAPAADAPGDAPADVPALAGAPPEDAPPLFEESSGFAAGIVDEYESEAIPEIETPARDAEEPGAPEDPADWQEGTAQLAAREEVADEKEPPKEPEGGRKGRRRTPRGKGSRKSRGDRTSKDATPEQGTGKEPPGGDEERPRLMDSSERRTDENDPPTTPIEPRPAPDLSDADLSFSMGRSEERRSEERPPAQVSQAPAQKWESDAALSEAPTFESTQVAETTEDEGTFREEEAPHADEQFTGAPGVSEAVPGEAAVIEFDEDYGANFEEPAVPRERRRRGPGRDERRGRGGRRPTGRPGFGRPKPPIQEIFKRGQEVLVQVIKEGIGTKGPTLSTYISIAGRYLVLMPGLQRVGVSRKIDDDETRRRLREILVELHPPRGLGFIIRTAGQDRNKKELQRDLAYLSRLWQVVVRRIRNTKSPCEIYQESDMVTRTIRDIFTGDIDTIWVDERSAFEAAKEFLTIVMPRFSDRIKYWDSPEPMFHKYGIEQEITRIQQRHVPLPHGGSIVIDQTEALVAIDVNSGNFRADNNAEETAYQMNLQAAKEIARQLRLRDLGGVIVNDFIDMREDKHRRNVERALREAVQRDRARTKILRISQFGIIEMTRQRIRPSLKRSVYQDCPHCHGTGQVKTVESMSIEVMRLLQLAMHRPQAQRIEIQVHDQVAHYLLNRKRKEIFHLEEQGGKAVAIRGAGTAVAPEHLEFVCYDNNNNELKFLPFEEPRPPARRRIR
jgi:ribonuclease E